MQARPWHSSTSSPVHPHPGLRGGPPSRDPPSRAALELYTPWPPSRPLPSPSQCRAHACPHALRSPLLPLPCSPLTPAYAIPWLPSMTATPVSPPLRAPNLPPLPGSPVAPVPGSPVEHTVAGSPACSRLDIYTACISSPLGRCRKVELTWVSFAHRNRRLERVAHTSICILRLLIRRGRSLTKRG